MSSSRHVSPTKISGPLQPCLQLNNEALMESRCNGGVKTHCQSSFMLGIPLLGQWQPMGLCVDCETRPNADLQATAHDC